MKVLDLNLYLKQSQPFRFVDEVLYCENTGAIKAKRFFDPAEDFFKGHFPGEPIVPGVLIVECMAQACRASLNYSVGRATTGFLATIERVKFIRPVRPNDELFIEAKPIDMSLAEPAKLPRYCQFRCVVKIANESIAKATLILYQDV